MRMISCVSHQSSVCPNNNCEQPVLFSHNGISSFFVSTIHRGEFLWRYVTNKDEIRNGRTRTFSTSHSLVILSFAEENPSTTTESYCSGLLEKYLSPSFELPTECHQFSSIRANIQKRRSNREEENNIAFQGMSPNEALEAIRAREHGRPHQAKILRRMTSHNPHKVESSWYWQVWLGHHTPSLRYFVSFPTCGECKHPTSYSLSNALMWAAAPSYILILMVCNLARIIPQVVHTPWYVSVFLNR